MDGTLAAWGSNNFGQLGTSNNNSSNAPVAVVQSSGVLFNRTVTAVAAGGYHCLALCADGTLAAWGYNNSGQLGDSSLNNRNAPVQVLQTSGLLFTKTVISIAAGDAHSLAVCSDGTMASWGRNVDSQLANPVSTQSTTPVVVNVSTMAVGERFTQANSGAYVSHTLALVASPPPLTAAQSWAQTNGVSSNLSLPGANGLANLLNFAFGMSPTASSNPPLTYTGNFSTVGTVVPTGGPILGTQNPGAAQIHWALYVRRKDFVAAKLTYTVKFSSNLIFWQDSLTVPTVLADDGVNQLVGVPYPALLSNGQAPLFFRISVSILP